MADDRIRTIVSGNEVSEVVLINPDTGAAIPPNRPFHGAVDVTPSLGGGDKNVGGVADSIYVGGAGDITLRLVNDAADVVFKAVPAGTMLNISPSVIRETGTGATGIIALYR
jgi:hypothetical protein